MESADDDDDDNVDGSSSFSIAPPHRDNALVSLVRSYLSLVTTVAKHCIGGVVGKGLAPGQGLGPGLGQELVRRGGYYRYGNGQEDTIMSSSSSVDNSEHSSILLPSASRPYGLAYLGAILYPNPTLTLT